MAANTNLQITNLDFDAIKQSLIQYFQSQSVFSDYNFTGSALTVLINLLAYNTHYLGYYLSMISKEFFLDSAQLRQSVVSLAKQLNYTPKSRNSASAVLNVTVTPPNSPTPPATITLNSSNIFQTTINGVNYSFSPITTYSANYNSGSNSYTFNNITVKEGKILNYTYTFDVNNPLQRFIIPSPNVDTSTIKVTVQNSSIDSTTNIFTPVDAISDLTPDSLVYFLEEIEDFQYRIYFGNGILGKDLENGNIIVIQYQVSSADAPNQANTFISANPIASYSNVSVTTVSNASGGSERESIDSIKFSAPLVFQSQNRVVTKSDFESMILTNFPFINSISVWGGQDNIPPDYGSVYISLQPVSGYNITSIDKDNILSTYLSTKKVVTVTPKLIDPNYTFVILNSIVKYNGNLLTTNTATLQNNILASISNYNSSKLNGFNDNFKYSQLVTDIDEADKSIDSNLTTIRVQKIVTPILSQSNSVTLNFSSSNPILPGTVTSNAFISLSDPVINYISGDNYFFDDDGLGTIRIIKYVSGSKVVVKSNSGTVDYKNGFITLTNFIPSSIVDNTNTLKISYQPVYNDIISYQNNIVLIDLNSVTLSLVTI